MKDNEILMFGVPVIAGTPDKKEKKRRAGKALPSPRKDKMIYTAQNK